MFIYTKHDQDIEKLKALEFPLIMTLENGTHVFSMKHDKDAHVTFSSIELESAHVTNELLF